MVEPQEDLILKMINYMQTSQSDMQALSEHESPYMLERAQQNVARVTRFQQEVNEECKEISQKVIDVRQKIENNIGGASNFDGFLLGNVSDYLDEFDQQVQKMNNRIDEDKQYWQNQAGRLTRKSAVQTTKIMNLLIECQAKIAQVIFNDASHEQQALDLSKCRLVDQEYFGRAKTVTDLDFRWPTRAQLWDLNIDRPPRLVEVRTRGEFNTGLTAVQLVFEGGLESPLIDTDNVRSDELRRFQLQNKEIKSVGCQTHDVNWPFALAFRYQDGSTQLVSEVYRNDNDPLIEKQIPDGHVIVGFYGKMRDPSNVRRICALGFIFLDISEQI